MNAAIVAAGLALGVLLLFVSRRQGGVERPRTAAVQPRGRAVAQPAAEEPASVFVAAAPAEPAAVPARAPRHAPRHAPRAPGRLGVPGEDSDRVLHSRPEPGAFSGQKLLVVGDGDAAVEAALSLLSHGNEVSLSCRLRDYAGLKPNNEVALRAAVAAGRLSLQLSSEVRRFEAGEVLLSFEGPAGRGEFRLPIDRSFVLGA